MPFFGSGGIPLPPPVGPHPGEPTYRLRDASGNLLLDLNDLDTVFTVSMDLGQPDIRAVVNDRPGAPGTIDSTQFHGARAVTWEGWIDDATGAAFDRFQDTLRGLCAPGNRMYLHIASPGWGTERRIYIRCDQFSGPRSAERAVQVTWRGIDGVLEDTLLSQYSIGGGGGGTGSSGFLLSANHVLSAATFLPPVGSGAPLPWTLPVTLTSSGSSATTTVVTNTGTTTTPPLITITGPCTGPKVLCATTGVFMSWPGLNLGDGEQLVVDSQTKTSLLGGSPLAPQPFDYQSGSRWPLVPPGDSQWQAQYTAVSVDASSRLQFRSRWL